MSQTASSTPADQTDLSRLRWRARRGLLENDLILQRFFARHADQLDAETAQALGELLGLDDNTLLDVLLQRTALPERLDQPRMHTLLAALRQP
ncbi:flavinator of succinate dehydrogenase [mine drainage metagenome]|uniref:Flavinator of succinate dehydrogenase n=1 Tax=mine drainage metagenome TaxID=410659 RepID=A0A1J5PMU6_9ZZZZ